jgi:hypothetical protein
MKCISFKLKPLNYFAATPPGKRSAGAGLQEPKERKKRNAFGGT